MDQTLEKYAERMKSLKQADREERETLISELVDTYCGQMFEDLAETDSISFVPLLYGLRNRRRT